MLFQGSSECLRAFPLKQFTRKRWLRIKKLIDKLLQTGSLSRYELTELIKGAGDAECSKYLFDKSRAAADARFGNNIYIRGLIEFSNYCKNNCYYCGIRAGNKEADRYRLNKDQIISCCITGYELGFRTFVLQSGEDPFYSDKDICDIVSGIKQMYPDCAVTLSVGEKSYEAYESFFKAGADRYLLRHETADHSHYKKLHPARMSYENRMRCLTDLKRIGFQVGTGFMVGSPYQTAENLADDILFLKSFNPHMIGIGPFLPHSSTPFNCFEKGNTELTLLLIGIIRLMFKNALIPATTSLGTSSADGRERGILAGANVVMPNLSPQPVRRMYALYDNKISTGEEAAESLSLLKSRLAAIGYQAVVDRGDYDERKENE